MEGMNSLFLTKTNHSEITAVIATWNWHQGNSKGEKSLPSLKCHSYLFLRADADIAEYLADCFEEWITEGVDVDGIDTADALNLNQEALDARYNCPDVQEREDGKVDAPDERHRDAEDGRQQAVKPIFCHSEGGEAGLPDAVETVCPFWFRNHIFKVNLDHVVVEMLGVAVDQVNLLGVRVVHLLLIHLVCHGLVVGLVDVALFPDGNSVEMSLDHPQAVYSRLNRSHIGEPRSPHSVHQSAKK